ncbi:extracellular solute-binding protein [Mycolicibacterium komossense]|uniref:extracellular solute-binding protein n=1 Tax=Mycolicibacterium komossense TaxID=1779 RepID=UPI0021F31DED|nr:extracellular solute-binding protein [Mycolicibacterium komossense]
MAAVSVSACGRAGGADTDRDQAAKDGLALTAFTSSQPGWNAVIPAFLASPQGAGIKIEPTYGGSGVLVQNIKDGKPADIVNLADAPSIDQLVQADKVTRDWNAGTAAGSPFGSVVTFVVREGNPKNIHNWGDLLQPGLQVVTANPVLTGSGKWGLVAGYAVMSNGGQDPAAGMAFLNALVLEHIKGAGPGTGREAADNFANGAGDVLLTTEANALELERAGKSVEHVIPPQTLRVDNVVAVVEDGPHVDAASRLNDFLYTADAQRLWARAGFRPTDPAVVAEFAGQYPAPEKLWTVADLGGWRSIDPKFFDSENGAVTKIFNQAVS